MQNIKSLLKKYYGYDSFHPVQEKVIKRILSGNDGHSLVIMPTGSGKSVIFQIPAMVLPGGTIVISPLIALMQDQVDGLRKKGIPATFINSSIDKKKRDKRLKDFINKKEKILYITPERFRQKAFRESISKTKISLLAIDEAHCISSWGHDFRPDYTRIKEIRSILSNPITIALTATATPKVQDDIIRQMGFTSDEIVVFHEGIDRPNLRLEVKDVYGDINKLELILKIMNEWEGPGIIYFSLIKTLEKFSDLLLDKKIYHQTYHGKLTPEKRRHVQKNFMNGETNLVLATNAFGMGVDKSNIRFVIHAEIPGSMESLYQEIGRAGRDGKESLALLMYDEDDLTIQMNFIKWSNPEPHFYEGLYAILDENMDMVNGYGIDYLREQLNYKNRHDFRVETALNMLDRFGVTLGSIEKKNLELTGPPVEILLDESYFESKLLNNRKQLLSLVNYCNTDSCRKSVISKYFGINSSKKCNNCDNCSISV